MQIGGRRHCKRGLDAARWTVQQHVRVFLRRPSNGAINAFGREKHQLLLQRSVRLGTQAIVFRRERRKHGRGAIVQKPQHDRHLTPKGEKKGVHVAGRASAPEAFGAVQTPDYGGMQNERQNRQQTLAQQHLSCFEGFGDAIPEILKCIVQHVDVNDDNERIRNVHKQPRRKGFRVQFGTVQLPQGLDPTKVANRNPIVLVVGKQQQGQGKGQTLGQDLIQTSIALGGAKRILRLSIG